MPGTIQGCVLAVHKNDVIYATTHGLADASSGEPCSSDTRFQLASVSKQFTAAAVLTLADRQRLSLDDPVTRWVPGCPESWRDITVHHLLCHSSGLGHSSDYPEIDLYQAYPLDEFVAALRPRPLHFPPGMTYRYSSPGYVLLAQIVQRANQEPYGTFLEQAVFSPLGMNRTFAGSPADRRDVARGHDCTEPIPSWELDTVNMGAGDVWSTVADVLRWDDALSSGEILSTSMRTAMFRRHVALPDQDGTAYGYGWCLGPLLDHPARHHDGDNAGYKAMNAWLTDLDIRCVILSNQDRTDAGAAYDVLRTVTATAED